MKTKPPFDITPFILTLCQEIAHELGVLEGAHLSPTPISLRRENKIKTIQSTLAIEGNTLTLEQITGIIEGKSVFGPRKDIQEVQNALRVYDSLNTLDPLSIAAFKKAHGLLMTHLIPENGQFRSKDVGIFKGDQLAHMAPPSKIVPRLMDDLFKFIKAKNGFPWLIKACVFHYELEFIHPFSDGNGRMGRLWQQLLLMKENRLFEFITVESLIKKNQKEYYLVLNQCDAKANSTTFIEFSLLQIRAALIFYSDSRVSKVADVNSRLEYTKGKLKSNWFTRKDYLILHKNISTATASRDLQKGLASSILQKEGELNQIKYRFAGESV